MISYKCYCCISNKFVTIFPNKSSSRDVLGDSTTPLGNLKCFYLWADSSIRDTHSECTKLNRSRQNHYYMVIIILYYYCLSTAEVHQSSAAVSMLLKIDHVDRSTGHHITAVPNSTRMYLNFLQEILPYST